MYIGFLVFLSKYLAELSYSLGHIRKAVTSLRVFKFEYPDFYWQSDKCMKKNTDNISPQINGYNNIITYFANKKMWKKRYLINFRTLIGKFLFYNVFGTLGGKMQSFCRWEDMAPIIWYELNWERVIFSP